MRISIAQNVVNCSTSTTGSSAGLYSGGFGTFFQIAELGHFPRVRQAVGVGAGGARGEARGEARGGAELLLKLLRFKFGPVSVEQEARVRAADFSAAPLGMLQEVEVMDGHNLRGRAGGREQRVRRVDDIEFAPGQRLDIAEKN